MEILNFPYKILVPIAILLALLPGLPEPHLIEKVKMLLKGNLSKPIDIIDLLWHSWALVLLGGKLIWDFVL